MSNEKTKQREAERCLEGRDERLSLARYRQRRRERDSSREHRENKTDTNQLFERVKYYISVYRNHRQTFQFLFPISTKQGYTLFECLSSASVKNRPSQFVAPVGIKYN